MKFFNAIFISINLLILCLYATTSHSAVVIISVDGFGYNYLQKFKPVHLLALAKSGAQAKKMLPVYPTKTFPNHLSIATGVSPAKHGLVHNRFYDRSKQSEYRLGAGKDESGWLLAMPIWHWAELQGTKSATYFWPESDAEFAGTRPSYFFRFNRFTSNQRRFDQIIDWLKLPDEQRPGLIGAYFSLVDDAGHRYGVESSELSSAVLEFDTHVGKLVKRLKQEVTTPVNLIIVSDHGMINIDQQVSINWHDLGNFNDFIIVNGQTQLMLYAKKETPTTKIQQTIEQLNAKSNGRFSVNRYRDKFTGSSAMNRLADITLDATPPVVFVDSILSNYSQAAHGYPPSVEEMGAIFIANGPNIKPGVVIEPFDNIHIFPLLTKLLGIDSPAMIEGDGKVLIPIVKDE